MMGPFKSAGSLRVPGAAPLGSHESAPAAAAGESHPDAAALYVIGIE
jgi:hypothetical protein